MRTPISTPVSKKAAAKTKPSAKAAAKKTTAVKTDAVSLLKDDHKRVKKLFKAFDKLKDKGDESEISALVGEIVNELTIHTTIEEEIFYPAVRKAIDEEDLLDEATIEHASAKDLIAQLKSMSPSEPFYNAKVTVLGEYVDHHVQEEEGEMFPKAKKAKVDIDKLGKKMATRRRAILKEQLNPAA